MGGPSSASLLAADDCFLGVIDVQVDFYRDRLDVARDEFDRFVARVAWLAGVAKALGVPTIVTEEDPARNGHTIEAVARQLAAATPVYAKPVFCLADVPEILAGVEATNRRTAVLVGMETDVCVAHSALGLVDRGYRVAAAADALYSPQGAHENGLARLRAAGVGLLSAKEVYYDWVRTLDRARAFTSANPDLARPPGFSL